jgi:hypothetical protein
MLAAKPPAQFKEIRIPLEERVPVPLITCPDCEARVSLAAPECVGCGRPLRAREPVRETPAGPVGMRRGIKLLVLGWGFLLMVTALFLITVPENEARTRQRQLGMEKALAGLRIIRVEEQRYHLAHGHYASWLTLHERRWPATPAEAEARRYYRVYTSNDRQTYISIQRWYKYGAECAELVRHGPETAASRAIYMGSWKLVANAPPRCRKTGFPWGSLHWAGIGYLDNGRR